MRKTIEIDETYRKIWDKHDKINIDIYKYEILYVTLRWLVSSPIWRETRDAHHMDFLLSMTRGGVFWWWWGLTLKNM